MPRRAGAGGPPGYDPAPVLALLEGLSSAEAADLCGVSSSTVRLWRLGRRGIGRRRVDGLAVRLGHSPYELWPTGPPGRKRANVAG